MNKQFNKKDYLNLLLISLFVLIVVLMITKGKNIYGSTTDWKDQHFLFADYFRNLFYHTGKLIPEFALNIGGGQNIFNFAYYGLLNPIIIFSYFFPFIDLMHYVIISSIIVVIVSLFLFYKWLKNNNVSSSICFITTLIFASSAPLIMHSHRHIMFINYMPFLLLGLIGIDKYFQDKKFYLITVSTFLLIFTSYYYSVASIIVLAIYYIYKYLGLNSNFNFKDFVFSILKFSYFIILGIMIASVLILPVFSTILSGRSTTLKSLNLLTLLIPKIDIGYILYNSYGIGLTSIAVVSLISLLFYKGKNNKFLFFSLIIFFCFPFILYFLNGALYINSKVLIPFLPLMCFIISYVLSKIIEHDFTLKKVLIPLFILIIVSYFINSKNVFEFFLFDSLIILVSILLYNLKNKKLIIFIPLCIISLINCFASNLDDELYTKKDYKKDYNENVSKDIKALLDNDHGFYRINNNLHTLSTSNKIYDIHYYQSSLYSSTYNGYYNDFYVNTFQNELSYRNSIINGETNNLLYQIYMGEKYIITKKQANLGYELIKDNNDYQIYENKNVMPIGYATSKLMSYDDYKRSVYPYNVEALLKNVIVDEYVDNAYQGKFTEYDLLSFEDALEKIDFNPDTSDYHLKFDKAKTLIIPLDEKLEDKILVISFDMKLSQSCSKGDTYITINGIKNKLTCKSWKYHNQNYNFDYVLATDNIDELNVQFSKGEFILDNIKFYTLDYKEIEDLNNNIDSFNVDYEQTKDNKIVGNIDVGNDGYFILKIPYDKGFKIYIDGKEAVLENVNDGFIGAKIDSGKHHIEVVYHAPLLLLGKIVSLVGIILFVISIVVNRKYEYFKNKFLRNKLVKFGISKYKQYEEIINYLFMGGCTTVVSIGTYTICVSLLNIHYQVSNVISWIFAVVFAFITNKLFVFKVKENNKLFREIYQFIKFRLLSLVIDMATMYILVDLIKINDFIAKILVQIIVVIINYVFSKLFIFVKKSN